MEPESAGFAPRPASNDSLVPFQRVSGLGGGSSGYMEDQTTESSRVLCPRIYVTASRLTTRQGKDLRRCLSADYHDEKRMASTLSEFIESGNGVLARRNVHCLLAGSVNWSTLYDADPTHPLVMSACPISRERRYSRRTTRDPSSEPAVGPCYNGDNPVLVATYRKQNSAESKNKSNFLYPDPQDLGGV